MSNQLVLLRTDNQNRLSIQYQQKDNLTGWDFGDTFINFSPSPELMKMFEQEIEKSLKQKQ